MARRRKRVRINRHSGAKIVSESSAKKAYSKLKRIGVDNNGDPVPAGLKGGAQQKAWWQKVQDKKALIAKQKAEAKKLKVKAKMEKSDTLRKSLENGNVSVDETIKYSNARKVNKVERETLAKEIAKNGKSAKAKMLANKIAKRERLMKDFETKAGITRETPVANNIYKGISGNKGSKLLSYKAPAPHGRIKIKPSKGNWEGNAGGIYDKQTGTYIGSTGKDGYFDGIEDDVQRLFAEFKGHDNIGFEFFHTKGGPGTKIRGKYKLKKR